ncbi:putative toxin-antitoxin system toxin component, PIN family [Azospira restricta]|uniref:Toxin-antitoxin system toxin component, PIN family n=1 Tax=Azospira restricta TaxID=404405 RepID=A0A974SMI3_9RHOO|nr:putative toxin-antitoxin system toxin component, PIN family [Azospira restricta]QRJ62244.1 putative toxin-antitoxin system toxin component, PIN family [Azospira restricta]
MKLVLDTNVVLDLLFWRDPRCAALAEALAAGRAHCVTDDACLAELERVLAYPQFALDEAAQRTLHAQYRALAEGVAAAGAGEPAELPRCRDADDQKFLELAARAGAELLLTRDRELLRLARSRRRPPPFAILVPEQAAARLAAPSPEHAR